MAATSEVRFVEHAGARLAWTETGPAAAPVLLLGNSLGSVKESWQGVTALLAQRWRLVCFDARGHGASTLSPAARGVDYSIELLGRDALAVADAAGAARFSYAGVSIGGMIGMWLGAHAAARLDRLVLSNTAAKLPAQIWDERIATVKAVGLASQADSTMQRWFTPAFHATGAPIIAATRAAFLAVDPDGYLGCAAAIRDMDSRPLLATIKVPTLVIAGTYDPSTPPELGRDIAAGITGAQYVELPLAHMPQLEQPATYVGVLEKFLAEKCAPT